MKKTIILSTIIGSLFFMSCTEEVVKPTNPSTTNQNVGENLSDQILGTWSVVSLTVHPAVRIGDYETNNPFEFEADCLKDDVIILKPSNQMERDHGALRCAGGEISSPGAWELQEDRSTLILDGQKYRILEVQKNQIRLSYEENGSQTKYVYTKTFARK